jgi:hypothetical protein
MKGEASGANVGLLSSKEKTEAFANCNYQLMERGNRPGSGLVSPLPQEMRMNDVMPWINALLAIGSLIVSVIALILSLRAQSQANAAQQRIVEIEEQRDKDKRQDALQARLQAVFRDLGDGSERLYLVNHGMAEARNVRVTLDGKPFAKHCAVMGGDSLPSLVGAGGEVSCLLAISMQCAPPFECEVRWDDDSGPEHVYRTTLTW